MILKLREVYRERGLTKGRPGPVWSTREVFINTEHIVMIRPNDIMASRLDEGLITGVKKRAQFCTISINKGQSGADITVVGSLSELEESVSSAGRLLRG